MLLAASRSGFLPVAGKQAGQITRVPRQSRENVLQPGSGLYLRCFAAAEQGVDNGGTNGRIVIAAEQVVFSSLCWQRSYVGIVR